MHCFTELTASAAVTHSISIRLLSATATNLVVIKTNLLQVFTIQQETHSSGSDGLSNGHQGSGPRTHLVLEHESDLYETVCALSASSLGRSEGAQALVIAFKDAKFAILGWDFYRHKLITRSIHYYEQDTLQGGPLAAITNYPSCYAIVDPQNRCLALVFGQRNVAFLPFRDEEDDGDGGLVNGDGESALQQLISPRTPRLPNGARQARASPYKPSFVLSLTSLDTAIRQPIHLDYLYEYREPTLGILYSQSQRSTALAAQHLDLLHFTVVSLDTDQRESQSIISVHGLPNDLHHVLSLPPPVAGALLVGDNEVIHVDQSAKTHGVAVNSAAKLTTSFSLSDQAYLELMLEDCQACVLPGPNGDVLLELRSGHSAIVSFVMDGRAVSGVKVRSISQYNDSWHSPSSASSLTAIRDDLVFRGSQTADSVLLSYDRKPRQSRLRAHPDDDVDGELELDDELDVDDELYSEATADMQQSGNLTRIDTAQAPGGEYIFKPQSSLENPGTLRQVAFGKGTSKTNAQSGLVTALLHGAANRSQLSLLSKQARLQLVAPALQTSAQRLWILSNGDASSSKSKSTSGSHQYCLLSSPYTDDLTSGETLLYEKQEDRFIAKADTEFEGAAGISIEVGVMGNGSRVVQVLADEVRIYDQDFNFSQIIALQEEDGTADFKKIVGAEFSEHHLVLQDSVGNLLIYRLDSSGELIQPTKKAGPFLSISVYEDRGLHLRNLRSVQNRGGAGQYLVTLTRDGTLQVSDLLNLRNPLCSVKDVRLLPQLLAPELGPKRAAGYRELISEILVADLGDQISKRPHLIVRTATDALIVYQLVVYTGVLRFLKLHHSGGEPQPLGEYESVTPLRAIENLAGLAVVARCGPKAVVLSRTSATSVRQTSLHGGFVRDLDYAQIGADKHGLAVLDDEGRLTLAVVKGLEQASKTGYLLSELPISSNVDAITFFEPESCYVVAASDLVPYEIASPPDQAPLTNGHKQHGPFPQVAQSTLKLFSSDDWTLIDEHPFEPFEQVTNLQTMHLLTSESFPTTSPFIVASTSRPPPNPATPPSGTLYIFTIAPTIPHPAYPAATHLKLKLILADAEIQPGAITSLHQLGSGFVGSVHGQKLIVRGFKADGSFLPVAFYDLPGYNPVLKVLPGPALAHGAGNLLAFADLMRGVQLVAFSEDPFRMTLAGRDPAAVPVASVEFLPHGRGLFLLAQDLALNLHLLQYKPEDARSSGGARLVRQAVFYVGQRIVDMQLLPRMSTGTVGGGGAGGEEADVSEEAMEVDEDPATVEAAYHVLVLQASGSLALITPIPEQQHRRMAALQSQLLSALEPVAGLSHKAYRAARDVKIGPGEAQALGPPVMLDGNVLKKWRDIGRDRLGEIERAIGMDVEEIEAAIWDVSGGGLLLE